MRENFTQFSFASDVRICEIVDWNCYIIGFHNCRQFHVHGFDDGHRRDVVRVVVGHLFGAAAAGFFHRLRHGAGDAIGVEDGAAFDVARAAANCLYQGRRAAQVAFLVSVENCYE